MFTLPTKPFKAVSFSESAIKKVFATTGWVMADTKHDGVRGNVVVDNVGEASWLSRVAKPIPALSHLNGIDQRWKTMLADDRCIFPEGFMLDGELMVSGVDFNTGSGLLRTVWTKRASKTHKGNTQYHVNKELNDPNVGWSGKHNFQLDPELLEVKLYAVLPIDVVESQEEYQVPNFLIEQHTGIMVELLREYFPEIKWSLSESIPVYSMEALNELYERRREEGHEGLVVKDPFGFYKRGKKSGWWKMKPEEEADGVVVGLVWGTNGLANEGKVIGFEVLLESGRVVNATNISKALMEEFTARVKEYTTECGANEAGCWYMNPYEGWQCQISYMEETPDGSLRHPSFDKWRGTEDEPKVKI